ncbi:MAG: GFA family protein [Paracoccaceae bacterium]
MMIGPREGGCLCGAVRFVAGELPSEMHACHCTTCRHVSGSATMSLAVRFGAMKISGAKHVVAYASSGHASRSFCGRCGTPLWYRSNTPEAGYSISAGLLDDMSGLVLAGEIYVDRKPAGYAYAGDHPRLTGAEYEARSSQNS